MQLDEALGRISEIRAQLVRTETFRGFRSLTVGASGVLGIVAAVIQVDRVPRPTEQVWNFVDLWGAVAIVSFLMIVAELAYRWSVSDSPLARRLTVLTLGQFVPCLVAGAVVTLIVAMYAQQIAWTLPGLWAILFALGIFACCRLLPKATFWVGVYYMATGACCLAVGDGPGALSPWMMVGTFGAGQLLAAGVLYYSLERSHEQPEA